MMLFNFFIGSTEMHDHPLYYFCAAADGETFLRTNAGLEEPPVHHCGKNGKPYPAVNVKSRLDGKWRYRTLARLVRECVLKMIYPPTVGVDHLPGVPKSHCGVDGTQYLNWHDHGRQSRAKQLGREV